MADRDLLARWSWRVSRALAFAGLWLVANGASGQAKLPSPTGTPTAGAKPSPTPLSPGLLRRPAETIPEAPAEMPPGQPPAPINNPPLLPPLGYTGPSSVAPSEEQEDGHFIPAEDRWRIGLPEWDRYGWKYPTGVDYPYMQGHWWDPYNQNVLKGDYPIAGQHTFLNLTATSLQVFEGRQVPIGTTPFESTARAPQDEFFGRPNQGVYQHFFILSASLFHGDTAFKPLDWQIRVTPIMNINHLDVEELGVVHADVRRGTTRTRSWATLEEWFLEAKLADLSPDYDFMSMRVGSQPFSSDFRGFIFSDTNRAVRLFGTRNANRDQFNIIYLDQQEKDTNSGLNTFEDRHQEVFIANYYRQDFIFPGMTEQLSIHYNHDSSSFQFDKNAFLVRPDPVGVFTPHEVQAVYLGWAGDGHMDRINVSHAFYWAFGHDSLNPLAGRSVDINAQMAALELSYDRDWARFRTSFFYASGDGNIGDGNGRGFDSIFDNPNFAGGEFSYWQRQSIKLNGTNLVNGRSIVPDLRSSKIQGQSNFVNPGLHLINFGFDVDVTPKLRFVNNCNFLWFDRTNVLEQFVFQRRVDREIGTDLSTGMEYRPFLNNNMIVLAGISTLLPGEGFKDLYDPFVGRVDPMVAAFIELTLTY